MLLELDEELLLAVLVELSGRDLGRLECAHPYFSRRLQATAVNASVHQPEPEPELESDRCQDTDSFHATSLTGRAAVLALARRKDAWRVSRRLGRSESWPYMLDLHERLAVGRYCAAGPECTLAVDCYGRLHSYGVNSHGQLGHNDNELGGDVSEPRPIARLAHEEVACVALRHKHAAAITTSGDLYTWGAASAGALGVPPAEATHEGRVVVAPICLVPERVVLPGSPGSRVVLVAVGDSHSACLTDDGTVFTWGYAQQGALGHGGSWGSAAAPRATIVYEPTRVQALSRVGRCIDVSCGGQTTAAVSATGALFMWGTCVNPHTMSFDDEQRDRTVRTPEQISGFMVDSALHAADDSVQERGGLLKTVDTVRVRSVSCGRYHFAAVGAWTIPSSATTTSSKHAVRVVTGVWTWGDGGDGQLGHGSHVRRAPTPRLIASDAGRGSLGGGSCLYTGGGEPRLPPDVCQVSCGESHTCCVTESGALYAWGSNLDGQLGTGDRADRFYPAAIDTFDSSTSFGGRSLRIFGRVLDASCGNRHTVIRTETAVLVAGSGGGIGSGGVDREDGAQNFDYPVLRLGKSRVCC